MTQEKQVPILQQRHACKSKIAERKGSIPEKHKQPIIWLKKEPFELSKKQTKHIQANSMQNRGTKRSDLEKRRSSIRNRHGKQNETVADFLRGNT